MDRKRELAAFVSERLLGGAPVAYDDALWEKGAIDSLGLVRLVSFIEQRFGLRVPHADVTPAAFASIEKIAAYVAKLEARPRGTR